MSHTFKREARNCVATVSYSQAYVCRRAVLSIFIHVHFPCMICVLNVRVGILFHIYLFEIIGYVIHSQHIELYIVS